MKKTIICMILILLGAGSLSAGGIREVDGIAYSEYIDFGSGLWRSNDYPYITAKLAENTAIDGITYSAKMWITLYKNGKVRSGTPAQNITLHGVTFPPGTITLYLKNDGKSIEKIDLGQNTTINGITYKRPDYWNLNGLSLTALSLHTEKLRPDESDYLTSESVYFHENGHIRSGILAEDTVIDGVSYRKNSRISFYENGVIDFGQPTEDTVIDGVSYRKDFMIYFYKDGSVRDGTASKTTVASETGEKILDIRPLTYDVFGGIYLFGGLVANPLLGYALWVTPNLSDAHYGTIIASSITTLLLPLISLNGLFSSSWNWETGAVISGGISVGVILGLPIVLRTVSIVLSLPLFILDTVLAYGPATNYEWSLGRILFEVATSEADMASILSPAGYYENPNFLLAAIPPAIWLLGWGTVGSILQLDRASRSASVTPIPIITEDRIGLTMSFKLP